MKKMCLLILTGFCLITAFSQQKEGKVVYERTMQMQIRLAENDQGEQELSHTRTDKFELLFGNNLALWQQADEGTPEAEPEDEGGVRIKMFGGGVDDISYYDLTKGISSEQREMFEKKFIIADSIRRLNWKLTGETKNILNHSCQKAVAQHIGTRMMMSMDNGKMQRKEISDTSNIVAWFTPDIPVSTGPSEYQSQLPGLILEMDINSGRQLFKATSISPKGNIAAIKEPKNGKKVTRDEFRQETRKMMDEMEKNNQGGGRVLRIN